MELTAVISARARNRSYRRWRACSTSRPSCPVRTGQGRVRRTALPPHRPRRRPPPPPLHHLPGRQLLQYLLHPLRQPPPALHPHPLPLRLRLPNLLLSEPRPPALHMSFHMSISIIRQLPPRGL
jgi:hypothetical protein